VVNERLNKYLLSFEHYYPDIQEWCVRMDKDVENNKRSVNIIENMDEISGLTIVKYGVSSKLCHLSVTPPNQSNGMGYMLAKKAINDLWNHGAQEIVLTMNEEILKNISHFYSILGFNIVDYEVGLYKKGSSEVIWKLIK